MKTSIKAFIASVLMTSAIAAAPAEAATVLFDFSLQGVSRINGSFSYDDAKTGVLGYTDLSAFNLTVVGDAEIAPNSYSLADVLAMPVYSHFAFDIANDVFLTSQVEGPDGPAILYLGAVTSAMGAGFLINDRGAYYDYATQFLGAVDTISVGTVPEPATWAMMLVGFGMVGAATRYRRRATTVAFG